MCDELWRTPSPLFRTRNGHARSSIATPWSASGPGPFAQLHTESPVGRVSYLYGYGNKIIIKYGWCSEDCAAPVLGYIAPEHHEKLEIVGKAIWDNYFGSKKIMKVEYEREEQ